MMSRRLFQSFIKQKARHLPSCQSPFSQSCFIAKTNSVAIIDENGCHTYQDLSDKSNSVANAITGELKTDEQKAICILTPNSADYAIVKFGIWASGNIAVPLCKAHPASTMEYYVQDSQSRLIITHSQYLEKANVIAKNSNSKLLVLEEALEQGNCNFHQDPTCSDLQRPAEILYTSGTTGKPKGVVLTHSNLKFQNETMSKAWGWTNKDSILHCLPLHHTHGIVNCLLTPLSVGAKVVILPEFDTKLVWDHLLISNTADERKTNVFMAVPTIYSKLISMFDKLFPNKQNHSEVKAHLRSSYRLMVSGSASLPQPVMERWQEISGHILLERYGMTEIGMAITNPLSPETSRMPGCVGRPFPGVEARILDGGKGEERKIVAYSDSTQFKILQDQSKDVIEGDLEIRSPGVFKEYFNKPLETEKEFAEKSWFKTGDTASMDSKGIFKILGRSSVDIIKSGGYKIGALDIERVLLSHPLVEDVAVVGVDDPEWGQKIVAVLVTKSNEDLSLQNLQSFCQDKMPKYHIPRGLKMLKEMPRNNMGKVNKKELLKTLFE